MLVVDDLVVSYGEIKALRGISIQVGEGEMLSLIGANGAGKTTLLNTIAGLVSAERGLISWKDNILQKPALLREGRQRLQFRKPSSKLASSKIVSLGISLAPEGRRIFADMTVQENLEMGGYLIRDKLRLAEQIEDKYKIFPRLKERYLQRAGSLSGGEQQMLCISRALMSSPKLLLLDEPSLGLAPIIVQNIIEIIVELNKERNITVLLVEQNAHLALVNSDRGYVLENGKISLEGSAEDLRTDKRVIAAYLGG